MSSCLSKRVLITLLSFLSSSRVFNTIGMSSNSITGFVLEIVAISVSGGGGVTYVSASTSGVGGGFGVNIFARGSMIPNNLS